MTRPEDKLTPLDADQTAHFGWAQLPPARLVLDALEAARPGCARYVGGCVRDSLMGAAPKDFDIATTLTPDEVTAALRKARLGAAPTGVEHGTITAIADHAGVEVTTLRADVSTDGRRATIAYTQDWGVDACRRDFTINAIYLTADNALFDPVGGVADIDSRRVRFIGAPEDRIHEDYLRILRFFRFSARFANKFDAAGLAAVCEHRAGVRRLSAERIGDEMLKILDHRSAPRAIAAMAEAQVLAEIWAPPAKLAALAALKRIDPDAAAVLGLAALWPHEAASAGLDSALRLSNAAARRRRLALAGAGGLSAGMDERAARASLYRLGEDVWRDAALVAAALCGGPDETWARLRDLPARWSAPAFPFGGKDLLARGVPPGPRVAKILRAVEEAWIAEDFPGPDRLETLLVEAIGQGAGK